MKKKMKKAFTLVELLVVIAILAVLSTVAIVGYNSFTEKAQKSADQQAVTQMNTVVEAAGVLENIETGADAYEAIIENGYDGGFKTAYGAYSMAWLAEEKAVVLVTQEAVAYPEEYAGTLLDKVSPLYTVEADTKEKLIDALAGKGSNYVNVNIPETGLAYTGESSKVRLTIEKNVTAVINLEGDLSPVKPNTLMNVYGKLTVNGNGNNIITINAQAGSSVVINDTIVGYEGSGIQSVLNNGGYLEVNNTTFVNDAIAIDNKPYSYAVISYAGTTVINNCAYEGATHGVFAANGGNITVNGGTYTLDENSSGHMFYNEPSGRIVINDGTFTQKSPVNGMINASSSAVAAPNQIITVKGGTFTGGTYSYNGDYSYTLDDFKA